ncbi:MAG: HNH endonuclease, partial [Chloroflexi bacterium]|nr:HNH endonuclease [Chloroflexota bacterium]
AEAFALVIRLQSVLTKHVSVVLAIASTEEIAHDVFETLNDRGIGVASEDLIRNFLVLRAPAPGLDEVDKHMESVWSLEPALKVEDFLRHYWLSHEGDLKSRSLYRELKTTLTQRKTDCVQFSRDLARVADIYHRITNVEDDDLQIQRYLDAAAALKASALLPTLLSIWDLHESPSKTSKMKGKLLARQRRDVLRALVSLYVRHNVIGNLESTALEEMLFPLAKEIRTSRDLKGALERIRKFAPKDAEFKKAFSLAEVRRPEVARYLLRELELARRPTNELDVAQADLANLEHIYSRSPMPSNRIANMDELVHRIGNLTLLAKRLNQKLGNDQFAVKQPHYSNSDILITKELGDKSKFPTWDPLALEKRQVQFAEAAINIWSMS